MGSSRTWGNQVAGNTCRCGHPYGEHVVKKDVPASVFASAFKADDLESLPESCFKGAGDSDRARHVYGVCLRTDIALWIVLNEPHNGGHDDPVANQANRNERKCQFSRAGSQNTSLWPRP